MGSRDERVVIRVGVADDHPLAREGLVQLLRTAGDVVVVGEAADGEEAILLLEADEGPDVILLDVRMPGMDGIEAARRIAEQRPDVGIILLSADDDPRYLARAVRAGARGYVLKDLPGDGLLEAVRTVAHGGVVIDLTLAGPLADEVVHEGLPRRQRPLTPREVQVLELLASGCTYKQIAASLGIAMGTVRIHIGRIFQKLGASDRASAVAEFLRRNTDD